MSVQLLKSRFLGLLRPLVDWLAARGTTPNEVTLLAMTGSLVVGSHLLTQPGRQWFVLVPAWLLIRFAMSAIATMLVREHGQGSSLGTYLSEFGDLVSDVVIYVSFALVAPFSLGWFAAIVALMLLSEFAAVLGPSVGASRRNEGPLGKGDRAVVFGALGAWMGLSETLPEWLHLLQPALCLALVLTIVNRIRAGIREADRPVADDGISSQP